MLPKTTGSPSGYALLYICDLVQTAGSKSEMQEELIRWKSVMESKGLKVNLGKKKILIFGKDCDSVTSSGEYPRSVCDRGVEVNFVLCTECEKWIYKCCSGLRYVMLARDYDYVCPTCTRRRLSYFVRREEKIAVGSVVSGMVDEVGSFCYLWSIVDREGSVERAVRARVATA